LAISSFAAWSWALVSAKLGRAIAKTARAAAKYPHEPHERIVFINATPLRERRRTVFQGKWGEAGRKVVCYYWRLDFPVGGADPSHSNLKHL
jgi:hypothetical protein